MAGSLLEEKQKNIYKTEMFYKEDNVKARVY